MPASVVTATIAAGESLSNAVDLSAGQLLRIRMPDDWTPANISFQMAPTDIPADYRDIITVDGSELLIGVRINVVMVFAGEMADTFREGFLKIRSGRAGFPIVQEAARAFNLVVLR